MHIKSYWHPYPGLAEDEEYPGRLIVLEGTDGVGRSTQITLLKRWLESSGIAVYDTGLTRSNLAGRHLREAREGHTMGRMTQALFYATDFADRLENEMVPALRAGYVVLTDRYVYSLIARGIVRGLDPDWMRRIYGFAIQPSAVYYLKITIPDLIPRVLASGGFDYWESGADYSAGGDLYDCFVKHQSALLEQFEQMADEFGFVSVDASASIDQTFQTLQQRLSEMMQDASLKPGMATPLLPPPAGRRPSSDRVAEVLREFLASLEGEG
ncbi:thymidylate kinase [bacterium]|nr:thymidylate kinase [bacterium]